MTMSPIYRSWQGRTMRINLPISRMIDTARRPTDLARSGNGGRSIFRILLEVRRERNPPLRLVDSATSLAQSDVPNS